MNITERIGVSAVQNIIYKEFGWSFREQPIDDCGIDAYIEIADGNSVSGKIIAVQIKSGNSYFREQKDGNVIFRISSRHQQYWSNIVLPVILVLYNPDTNECIWEATDKMDHDGKLHIPKLQSLSSEFKNKLKSLANLAPYVSAQRNRRVFIENNKEKIHEQFVQESKKDYEKIKLVIDFGSSRSMFGYMNKDGSISYFKTRNDKNYFDTVIGFDENYQLFIGEEAVHRFYGNNIKIVKNFKRELGKKKEYQIFNIAFTAEELTTLYLSAVIYAISKRYKVELRECLIASPTNFSYEQRLAYRKCIEQCNLKIRRAVLESTCPGLYEAYKFENENGKEGDEGKSLIVDIGGGTTDISLIENGDGVVEVLISNGNNQLGGFDYDCVLQELIYQKVTQKYPNICQDEYLRTQIELKSEELKMFFSEIDVIPIYLTNCYDQKKECRMNCLVTITKEEFFAAAVSLDAKIEELLDKTLKEAEVEADELLHVYLGGAGGNICTIKNLLKRKFPGQEIVSDYTEKSVLSGLAVQSGKLQGIEKASSVLLLQAISCEIKVRGKAFKAVKGIHGESLWYKIWEEEIVSFEDKETISVVNIIDKDCTIPDIDAVFIKAEEAQRIDIVVNTGKEEYILGMHEFDDVKDDVMAIIADIDANSALYIKLYRKSPGTPFECRMNAGPFYLI